MRATTKHSRRTSLLTLALLSSLLFFFTHAAAQSAQDETPANFKVAFIGDQSLGPNAVAVLNLIKSEGAQAVLHSGDFDYVDNPAAWDAQINSVLGADFPYFATVGNHDELAWTGAGGYQHYLEGRFTRLGITWSGRLGVRSTFYYKGIFFVLTAPGIESGLDDGKSDLYIRDQLAADHSVWSVCSWHKNQQLMQLGTKTDETGWGVYEEARKGGAIIATAHEHSYSRTHLLSAMSSQTVASTSKTLRLTKGNSFAFVSGLGGHSVRAQSLGGAWWASAYASTCLAGDPVCQPNASPGALFAVFNVDGQPNKAAFYFKDVTGKVVDSFVVFSNVETPFVGGVTPQAVEAGGAAFALTVDGAGFTANSVVQLNGSARPTTFVSDARLTASVSAADIASAGSAQITVMNPPPGGGTSNAVTLTINNPAPVIASLSPSSAYAGGAALTLAVGGAGFNISSVVRLSNSDRATTFVSPTQLKAVVTQADLAAPADFNVTVFNPSPGGGTSNAKTFQVVTPPPVLITDEVTGRAVALDSVTWTSEPLHVLTPDNFSADSHTRVSLFATGFSLAPGEGASAVTAHAEDSQSVTYSLPVEFVGRVPGFDWLTQVIVKLPDGLSNAGEVRVYINVRGTPSNKAPLAISPRTGNN